MSSKVVSRRTWLVNPDLCIEKQIHILPDLFDYNIEILQKHNERFLFDHMWPIYLLNVVFNWQVEMKLYMVTESDLVH